MTIDHTHQTTIIDQKMIHILLALGLITVVDRLIQMSGEGEVRNR